VRIPRSSVFKSYSGGSRPVDTNLLLDRLPDNLDIQEKGWAAARARPKNNNPLALCDATGSESHG
jgi:hypothetical protein